MPPLENPEDGRPVIALEAMEGDLSDRDVTARFRTLILSDKDPSAAFHKNA
jgi:hypothetical protein